MQRSRSNPANSRQKAERRGHLGETVAALYLRLKFYSILARRVKTPVGEIDLIARRGKTLAFVEVKTRKNLAAEEEAHGAVNAARIVRAANWYLTRHKTDSGLTIRFDLIFLAGLSWPRHIPNAFEAF